MVEIENSSGDMFEPGAYWRELEQAGHDIDDSIMNVEGTTHRALATILEEHAAVFADRPK